MVEFHKHRSSKWGLPDPMRRTVKKVIYFDDSSPVTVATVQDGDIITAVRAEVVEAWDGDGTVTLGDGDDADGYADNSGLAKSGTGYKLTDPQDRGVYLWDPGSMGVGARPLEKAYTGADTIDAFVTTGTSTQGEMVVYVELVSLKPV